MMNKLPIAHAKPHQTVNIFADERVAIPEGLEPSTC